MSDEFLFCFSKAAELAAKKSRVKQSLIKRARSVAIFSLKLKERRAREAEKQANLAIETEKVASYFLTLPNCFIENIFFYCIGKQSASGRR